MKRFLLQLNDEHGHAVWIDADAIVAFREVRNVPHGGGVIDGTDIFFAGGGRIFVKETPLVVLSRLREAQMAGK